MNSGCAYHRGMHWDENSTRDELIEAIEWRDSKLKELAAMNSEGWRRASIAEAELEAKRRARAARLLEDKDWGT